MTRRSLPRGSPLPKALATFHPPDTGSYQIKVLAPGFAAETVDVFQRQPELTIQLRLATASETVVVSATRTPVPGEAAGADVDSLSGAQLTTMQPATANDAMRFLPGAVINTAGQRGGLSSLFVRGGESNYNKVIVDGVTINEPGGTFDFGTLSLAQGDRMEFVRGTQSTLYGSDAMTSVVQVWTRTGTTHTPELRFGADGGNFGTASGHASLAGADGRFDYNVFGRSVQHQRLRHQQRVFRFSRRRERRSRSSAIAFLSAFASATPTATPACPANGTSTATFRLFPIDGPRRTSDPFAARSQRLVATQQHARQRRTLCRRAHRMAASLHRPSTMSIATTNSTSTAIPRATARSSASSIFPSHEVDHINRAGFEYQGDYSERTWAHTTFGYRVENENGFVGDVAYGSQTHGQRLNNDRLSAAATKSRPPRNHRRRTLHPQQRLRQHRRSPHCSRSGRPCAAVMIFSGTRLRFSYATGFKEPRLEETFAGRPISQPNPGLKPERLRAFEAGFQQGLFGEKYQFSATYFNNLFHDQINYVTVDPVNFIGEYVNVNTGLRPGRGTRPAR